MVKTACIFSLLLFIGLSISSHALENNIPNPVKANIYTTTPNPKAGGILKVGVHFKLDPGWHIYWKNAGDSGLPTRVQYTVPDGFQIQEAHYPLPKSFLRAGNILDYGYEDELLLITEMYVPENHDENAFKISSQALWVVCREVCIPGSENLELRFPVKSKSSLADDSIFESWLNKVPRRIEKDQIPFEYSVKKQFSDNGKLVFVDISLNWLKDVSDIEIFPDTDKSVYMKDIKLIRDKKISSYSFYPVIFKQGVKDLDSLKLVISYKDADGRNQGIETILSLDS